MFEIKKRTAANRTIRMPDTLFETLKELAKKNNISFNQVVVQCCEYAIKNLNPSEERKIMKK